MAEGKINPKADFFFEKEKRWQPEVEKLRLVCLVAGLDEEVKWGCPCYTLEGKNIVLIHTFKEYCALLFFKGVLLTDAEGILVQQTENVQVSRQMRLPECMRLSIGKLSSRLILLRQLRLNEKACKLK